MRNSKLFLLPLFSYFLLASFSSTSAELMSPIAAQEWQWKLESANYSESKVSIFIGEKRVVSYLIECNLENNQADESDEHSRIEKVISRGNNYGLLLITCSVGAHSKLVEIYNPINELPTPVFSKTGSYYAGWKLVEHQLVIYYDQPCKENQKKCDRFYKVSLEWPPKGG